MFRQEQWIRADDSFMTVGRATYEHIPSARPDFFDQLQVE